MEKITSKFKRSQKAHKRLIKQNDDLILFADAAGIKPDKDALVKRNYHQSVWNNQYKESRVLNKTERKKLYQYHVKKV